MNRGLSWPKVQICSVGCQVEPKWIGLVVEYPLATILTCMQSNKNIYLHEHIKLTEMTLLPLKFMQVSN